MHEGHLLLGGEVGSSLGLGTSPLRSRQRGVQRERQPGGAPERSSWPHPLPQP